MKTKISLDLRTFDTYNEKFEIINSDTKESIASVNKTIDYLKQNNIKELYPCHCTSF